MSEEMAVSDNTTGDEAKVSNDEATTSTVAEPEEVASEAPSEPAVPAVKEPPTLAEVAPDPEPELKQLTAKLPEVKEEPESDDPYIPLGNTEIDLGIKKEEDEDMNDEVETFEHNLEEDKRGIKRRASEALSDIADDDFKGFDEIKLEIKTEDYSRILERLEAEVTAASKDLVPLRTVMATPPAPSRASKRPRKDTDGSRPSSALSSRSDGDGGTDASTTSSPAQRGRRATTEMSSPLLRVPLERGWKRELVYRAALDAHSRRNADIYYYTPQGKKLRSTREVAEHLSGTGLTSENFSFFKEPLGVDDPEKEIIRDAKMIRRIDSPVAATVVAPVEGKRTPKPKPPKGASPEPTPPATAAAANKSPPAKIKVKSMGSRLSNSAPPASATPPVKQQKKPQQQQPQQQQQQTPTTTTPTTTDNNNSAAWKKPSGGECSALPARPPQPPPPLHCRPAPPREPDAKSEASRGRQVQPCSMACGRGAVPSLSCAACLCLYHPACAGYAHVKPPDPFMCKNCRKSSSPPLEPPPLTHKSGVTTISIPPPTPVPVPVPVVAPVPRRVPVPVPAKVPRDKRVLLRMKVAGGTPDGERVWAVAGAQPAPQAPPIQAPPPQPLPVPVPVSRPLPVPSPVVLSRARAPRPALPQGLAVFNGRRFVVVPRNMVNAAAQNSAK